MGASWPEEAAEASRGERPGRTRPLTVRSVSIRGFRNLSHVDLDLGERFNVFAGDNGQGKTNLLEAVYVLSTSRSFRTSRLGDLVERGVDTASLRASIDEDGTLREQTLGLRRGLRAVRIDGKRPGSLAAYAVSTPTVVFHPGSTVLAAGAGAERRKLLDRVALYLSPHVMEHTESYGKALRARQRALDLRGPSASDLDAWEDLMSRHGTALGAAREAAFARVVPKAQAAFARLGPGDPLRASYAKAFPSNADAFREALARSRGRDRARGAASLGPQRDDLVLEIGERPVRAMASQGQQRAVVLALKIAEIDVIAEVRGVQPLLLLDDVSSELDRGRTAAFVSTLLEAKGQVLLTTTRPEWVDAAGLSASSGRRDFIVTAGQISPRLDGGRSPGL